MIELLVPEQPGVSLPHDAGLVFAQTPGEALGIEFVGLANPVLEHLIECRFGYWGRRLAYRIGHLARLARTEGGTPS